MERYIYYLYKNGNEKILTSFKKSPCYIKILIILMFVDLAILFVVAGLNKDFAWIPAVIELGIIIVSYFISERRDVAYADDFLDNHIKECDGFIRRLTKKGLYNIDFILKIKKRYDEKIDEINKKIQRNDDAVKKSIVALLVPTTIDLFKTIITGSIDYSFFGLAFSLIEIMFLVFVLVCVLNTLMTTIYDSKIMEYKQFVSVLDSIILMEKFGLLKK